MEAKHKIPSDADSIPIGDLRINDIPVSLFLLPVEWLIQL